MDNRLDWDPELQVYRVNLDAIEYRSISVAVVRSVAVLEDTSPTALQPLQKSIDPDALDDLLRQTDEDTRECRIHFRYQGYSIRVIADSEIRLSPSGNTETIAASGR
ncbi:HalOD1 output domain-containing protein [Halomicrobium urmianum]|uniref:HalOD1 output domain-containing protein n=1 Tax=Halomicrobium urmianum TaxID=1586233 RepID=UPI001CDA4E30